MRPTPLATEAQKLAVFNYIEARAKFDQLLKDQAVISIQVEEARAAHQVAWRACKPPVPGVYAFPNMNGVAVLVTEHGDYPELIRMIP